MARMEPSYQSFSRAIQVSGSIPAATSSSRRGMERGRMFGFRMNGLMASMFRSCSACQAGSAKNVWYGGSGLKGLCGSPTWSST